LTFAGLGSRTSARLAEVTPAAVRNLFAALLLVLLVTYLLTVFAFDALLHVSLPWRVAVSVALLAAPSFLMGFPFPLVVRVADRVSPSMVPWGWALNGYGSVLGSFFSVIAAIFVGFTVVYGMAMALYALAAGLLVSLCREAAAASPAGSEPAMPEPRSSAQASK
jgi:hypothetical protein